MVGADLPEPKAPLSEDSGIGGRLVFARICGLLPLVCGVVVYVLWFLTGSVSWMWAGLLVILGGLVLFVLGVVALLGVRRRCRVLPCFLLLLVNFPVAFGILRAVGLGRPSEIVVENRTGDPLVGVSFSRGDAHGELGDIPPGQAAKRVFLLPMLHSGYVHLRYMRGGLKVERSFCLLGMHEPRDSVRIECRPDGSFGLPSGAE